MQIIFDWIGSSDLAAARRKGDKLKPIEYNAIITGKHSQIIA